MSPPSRDRILTTHTGSLPRPDDLVALMIADEPGPSVDALATRVRVAVREIVEKQRDASIDIPSDGEVGKRSFLNYVAERLSGVHVEETVGYMGSTNVPADIRDYPDMMRTALAGAADVAQGGKAVARVMVNDGEIEYVGHAQVQSDIANLKAAVDGGPFAGAFMSSISPGSVASALGRTYYSDQAAVIEVLGHALSHEYRAIVDAGLTLQIDAPEFGCKHMMADVTLDSYRTMIATVVAALNRALDGLDPDRVRVHVCWGNYPGPHHHDVPLSDVLDLVYQVNANGISVEAANPRHQHEWRSFQQLPLPTGKYVIPGVIDVCTPYIEHPQVVADRIVRYADVVGRERLVAGTDCGFGSEVNRRNVPSDIAFAKLATLAHGAKLATDAIWSYA